MRDPRHRAPLSPDGVALARLSGRRVLVFERDRMGGRERRHQGCRKPEALADRDDRRGRRLLRCGVLRARASRDRGRRRQGAARRSPSSPPRSRPRRSAIWKRPRRAAPSSRRRAPRGPARRSIGSRRPGTGRSPIRSRSASRRPATASRSSRRSPPILHAVTANLISAGVRLIPLGPDRRAARCSRRSNRSSPRPRARALGDAARSGRRRGLPRRSRQHAPRDPVHAAVPFVTMRLPA